MAQLQETLLSHDHTEYTTAAISLTVQKTGSRFAVTLNTSTYLVKMFGLPLIAIQDATTRTSQAARTAVSTDPERNERKLQASMCV